MSREIFSLDHLIKTCYKGSNPSYIDHIITNLDSLFMKSYTVETGISDHHKLIMSISLHKKWSFPLRISSVNVTKSARFTCTEEILNGKPYFLCSALNLMKRGCWHVLLLLIEKYGLLKVFSLDFCIKFNLGIHYDTLFNRY